MSSRGAQPPPVSCRELVIARSPFSCHQFGQSPEVKRGLQREVTRILITPHCTTLGAGMPQVNPLLLLQKYSQAFSDRPLACLKSQLHCLQPLFLEITLQFWAGRCLFWFSEHFCFAWGKKNGFCNRQEFAFRQEWLKQTAFYLAFGKKRAHRKLLCRTQTDALLTRIFNREMNATLRWEMSQNQLRKPS